MVSSNLDPKFREQVSELPGGQNLKMCYQCGTCNAGCPVREIDEGYNPRKIIRMTVLGMRDRVLSSHLIWLCSQCYTCEERCPQDVWIPEVMDAIKNLAVREGYIPDIYAEQAEIIGKLGKLYGISDFENRRRLRLGLPSLPSKNFEVPEIYKITGLDERLLEKGGREA